MYISAALNVGVQFKMPPSLENYPSVPANLIQWHGDTKNLVFLLMNFVGSAEVPSYLFVFLVNPVFFTCLLCRTLHL